MILAARMSGTGQRMTDRAAIDWAEQIRCLRRTRLLKQAALAATLGVDQATVSRWERGRCVPDLAVQRRLRDLLRREVLDESLLNHSVTVSPGTVVLSDCQRIMQAVSVRYSEAHGMPQSRMPGQCNKGRFDPESEARIEQLARLGFYRGDVASVTYFGWAPSLSGHRAPVPIKIVWTPVRLPDRVFLRGDRVEISEGELTDTLSRGEAFRVVMVDDLIR